jgi:hypothetical protein
VLSGTAKDSIAQEDEMKLRALDGKVETVA